MIIARHVETGLRRQAGHVAMRRTEVQFALAATAAIALAMIGGAARAMENGDTPAPQVAATALSMSDEEVAATIRQLNLELTDKPVSELLKGWRKPTKAIVIVEGSPQWLPWLQTAAPDLKMVVVDAGGRRALSEAALAEIADADVQIGGSCRRDILQAARKLQMIISAHVGVEGCFTGDVPGKLLDGEIIETNQKKTYGVPIATHAIAMMLALDRGLDLYVRQNDAEQWVKPPPGRLRYPQGQTMLVAGLGGLGTDVAKLGHALGMKIIATRASSHEGPDFVDYVGLARELPDLIGRADVVVSALPVTRDTIHVFNADLFGRMKKGALFINVSRGAVVDHDALVDALKSGHLGGAGLDVTQPEPLPKGDQLWHAPNVIITPHMSAHFSTEDSVEQMGNNTIQAWAVMRENLRRYVAGDRVYSLVNPKLGY